MTNQKTEFEQVVEDKTGLKRSETLMDNAPKGMNISLGTQIAEMLMCADTERYWASESTGSSFKRHQNKIGAEDKDQPMLARVYYETLPTQTIFKSLHDKPFGEMPNSLIRKIQFGAGGSCGEINFKDVARYDAFADGNAAYTEDTNLVKSYEFEKPSYEDLAALANDEVIRREALLAGQKAMYDNIDNIAYGVAYLSVGNDSPKGTPFSYDQPKYIVSSYIDAKSILNEEERPVDVNSWLSEEQIKDDLITGIRKYGTEIVKASLLMNQEIAIAIYSKNKSIDTLERIVNVAKSQGVLYSAAYLPKIFAFSAPQRTSV